MYKPRFPKPIRKKKALYKKATTPESMLQGQVNSILKWMGVKYFRAPDLLYRLLGWDSRLSAREKGELSKVFAGMPDNIVFVPLGNFCLCLNLELKSDIGKLSPRQKKYASQLPVTVVRTLQETQELVKGLLSTVEFLEPILAEKGLKTRGE